MAAVGGSNFDRIFKITLSGDSGVGKSNIISRFTNNRFMSDHSSTVGVEFSSRVVTSHGSKVKAQMWDTAGQERFRAITNVYYRGAMGALLVYDVTSQASFAAVPRWLRELRDHAKRDIVLMLVGNKIDCDEDAAAAEEGADAVLGGGGGHARQVPRAEAEALAAEYGLLFAEVSAKTGAGVEDAMRVLIDSVYETVVARESGDGADAAAQQSTVDIAAGAGAEDAEKNKKCCK